ncbi:MAG: hypothetical protein IRZ10_03020 [Thermoflavifilum sp.]|nr:hypothetical protein [Thermoflavifilum sp.]MCL6513366.1 hypothetical protein [Alicyclobacillus sp.]
MEGPKRRPTSKGPKEQRSGNMGRVVDLREWKRKRRLRQVGYRRPALQTVFGVTVAVLIVTILATAGGCVPWDRQADCILLTWFAGLIGLGLTLVLRAYRHIRAPLLMTVYLCCLVLSFGAALVKVSFGGH